jgi:hypothetical protein
MLAMVLFCCGKHVFIVTDGLAAAKPSCIDTGEVDTMETDTGLSMSIEKESSALPLEPLLANSYKDEFAILDGEWIQACRVSSERASTQRHNGVFLTLFSAILQAQFLKLRRYATKLPSKSDVFTSQLNKLLLSAIAYKSESLVALLADLVRETQQTSPDGSDVHKKLAAILDRLENAAVDDMNLADNPIVW